MTRPKSCEEFASLTKLIQSTPTEPRNVHGHHSDSSGSSTDASEPHDFEREPNGLFILHPTSDVTSAQSKPEVEYI